MLEVAGGAKSRVLDDAAAARRPTRMPHGNPGENPCLSVCLVISMENCSPLGSLAGSSFASLLETPGPKEKHQP